MYEKLSLIGSFIILVAALITVVAALLGLWMLLAVIFEDETALNIALVLWFPVLSSFAPTIYWGHLLTFEIVWQVMGIYKVFGVKEYKVRDSFHNKMASDLMGKSSNRSNDGYWDVGVGRAGGAATNFFSGSNGSISLNFSPAISVPVGMAGGFENSNFTKTNIQIAGAAFKVFGAGASANLVKVADNQYYDNQSGARTSSSPLDSCRHRAD
ncbi:hypothetical protein ACFE33_15625 (plasmid) [Falsihalocynthiibacter sp. SS001]|uniref:hypothetical protein n=1 Tax=Falsihalocynthiibacter sp. SS001 TaxID=3349698 RepID=UPI0036D237F1